MPTARDADVSADVSTVNFNRLGREVVAVNALDNRIYRYVRAWCGCGVVVVHIVCVCVSVYAHIGMFIYTCMYIYICMYVCVCIYVHIYMYIFTCICIFIIHMWKCNIVRVCVCA